MIEGIFQSFRGDDKENCPPWSFSCDAEGDAVLEVNEIVCPLDLDPDRFDYSSNIGLADDIIYDSDSSTYLEGIRTKIYDGLGALVDQQVTIDTSSTNVTLRVLMYSEQDAMDAADWLSLNTTEDLPDEVDSKRCRLNDEALQINLNEVYGDITPSPTDSCCQIKIIFALFFICIISLLL